MYPKTQGFKIVSFRKMEKTKENTCPVGSSQLFPSWGGGDDGLPPRLGEGLVRDQVVVGLDLRYHPGFVQTDASAVSGIA